MELEIVFFFKRELFSFGWSSYVQLGQFGVKKIMLLKVYLRKNIFMNFPHMWPFYSICYSIWIGTR